MDYEDIGKYVNLLTEIAEKWSYSVKLGIPIQNRYLWTFEVYELKDYNSLIHNVESLNEVTVARKLRKSFKKMVTCLNRLIISVRSLEKPEGLKQLSSSFENYLKAKSENAKIAKNSKRKIPPNTEKLS